jgi:phosphatidate phosphatase APP1
LRGSMPAAPMGCYDRVMKALPFVCCVLLSACGARQDVFLPVYPNSGYVNPLPQASPSATPTPTAKPGATPTPKPAATPKPVATPKPTPQPSRPPSALPEATPLPASSGKPVEIRLYRTYGTESQVHLKGRVIKPETPTSAAETDSRLTNLRRNLGNFTVPEVAGVQVTLHLDQQQVTLTSNHEGMLLGTEALGPLTPGFHTLRAELAPGQSFSASEVTQEVVIHPAADTTLGFVSDIDDTILKTGVSNKLEALKNLFLNNEYTSQHFPGTPELYTALDRHNDGQLDGDILYLSGSPINYAERLQGFLQIKGFPKGPLELKKWGYREGDDSPTEQVAYKLDRLRQLFQTYPKKPFILFGDSSEKDADIYLQISREFPGQVKGIYINNVTGSSPAEARFRGVHLTRDAGESAADLFKRGLITAEDLIRIQRALPSS